MSVAVRDEEFEPAPFDNEIVSKEVDKDGHTIFAMDDHGNVYCWDDYEECYCWGLTLEQKVKMDGLSSVTATEQRQYVKERAWRANARRWEKQKLEDSTRRGLRT